MIAAATIAAVDRHLTSIGLLPWSKSASHQHVLHVTRPDSLVNVTPLFSAPLPTPVSGPPRQKVLVVPLTNPAMDIWTKGYMSNSSPARSCACRIRATMPIPFILEYRRFRIGQDTYFNPYRIWLRHTTLPAIVSQPCNTPKHISLSNSD